jgi:hypothetical protein
MLSVSPANAYGTFDGVATFGGAMPTSTQLDQLRGLGLKVQGFKNLRSRCCAVRSRRSSTR